MKLCIGKALNEIVLSACLFASRKAYKSITLANTLNDTIGLN